MENNLKKKAVALFGPTAAGKTEISIELAKTLNLEIVNLDSVQIYKGMDIGSAKPTKEELSKAVHHLIDIASPSQPMNSFDIVQKALEISKEISQRGKIPLFCGGTGLYFKALFDGMFEGPSQNPEIRARLKKEAEQYGLQALYERLKIADPETAQKVSPNDYLRIERALEVFEITGQKISHLRKTYIYDPPYQFVKIAISYPRQEVYDRINQRVDKMISMGLVDEVEKLIKEYPQSYLIDNTIGYKEVKAYLLGQTTLEEMKTQLKQNTRRFAKRQFTLFRHLEGVQWFEPPILNEIIDYIKGKI